MTATNHALTGAAVAVIIRQPLLALPLAFLSHFACDALPHFGFKMKFGSRRMYLYLMVEAVVLLVVAITLVLSGVPNLLLLGACAVVAMSPDVAWFFYGLKGQTGKTGRYDALNRFHAKIQWSETSWGIIPEFFWTGGMLILILSHA